MLISYPYLFILHILINYELTIKWDKEHSFTRVGSLKEWNPSEESGVYVIVYRKDKKNKPENYSILYVGQSDNFVIRDFENHHKRDCWLKYVDNDSGRLSVYLYLMPNSTEDERLEIESKVIEIRDPPCND